MSKLISTLEGVIAELLFCGSSERPWELNGKSAIPSIPSILPVSNEGGIFTSVKAERGIAELARQLREADQEIARNFSFAEWQKVVRSHIGRCIDFDQGDAPNGNQTESVLTKLRASVLGFKNKNAQASHTFGCFLFEAPDFKGFRIGPVQFDNRATWLDDLQHSGKVSDSVHRRVSQVWMGRKPKKRTGKGRTAAFDKLVEDAILSSVGSCTYVCTVDTNILGNELARDNAALAARMAIASIDLIWGRSRNNAHTTGLLIDTLPIRRTDVSFNANKTVSINKQLQQITNGHNISQATWDSIFGQWGSVFSTVGRLLSSFLAHSAVDQPESTIPLYHALFWYYRASRDSNSLTATVSFASCLDALAGGKKTGGILNLIESLLGIENSRTNSRGETLKEQISRIYGLARSRTLHGNNPLVAYDWEQTRVEAEWYARQCLIKSLSLASE